MRPPQEISDDRSALRPERVWEPPPQGRGGEVEQPPRVRPDPEVRVGNVTVADADTVGVDPEEDRDIGVGRVEHRDRPAQERPPGRIACEVLLDEVRDHRGEAARLAADHRDRHSSRTTFVASRLSNRA